MKIIGKEVLVNFADTRIIMIKVLAPDIARSVLPGQFIALMVCEKGERIPLTIVDKDSEKGIISIIFQEAGFTTRLLGKLNPGDSLYALVGPLGHPTEVKSYGKVILVGGGVGIAEIYPLAKALKDAANKVTVILGARSKKLLLLEKELKAASDQIYIATDDGSCGEKGFTTDILRRLLLEEQQSRGHLNISYGTDGGYDLVYAVGPIPMMRNVALLAHDFKVKTLVSLNPLMVDATGMCGCCRVTVAGKVKFSCVDGPDFDASQIDWDELVKRNNAYRAQEKHICRIQENRPRI